MMSIPNMSSAVASRDSNEFEIKALKSPVKGSESPLIPSNGLSSPIKRPFPDRIIVEEVRFDTADTKLKP